VSGKVISVVVLTHNRHELLRRCVNDVLLRTSEKTREIVIWDNGSDDGTREYLEALTDRRIRVVRSPENLGMNAYGRAFGLATQDYLIELDDDVIEAPARWDETLLEAFLRLPKIGYLAASLVDDPNDSASRYLTYLREQRNAYTRRELNGVAILEGPQAARLRLGRPGEPERLACGRAVLLEADRREEPALHPRGARQGAEGFRQAPDPARAVRRGAQRPL
jgi:glycosyltransferase involved in cell wall biosynthesis